MSRLAATNAATIRPGTPSNEARITRKPENATPSVDTQLVAVIDDIPIMRQASRSFANGPRMKLAVKLAMPRAPTSTIIAPPIRINVCVRRGFSLTQVLAAVIKSLSP